MHILQWCVVKYLVVILEYPNIFEIFPLVPPDDDTLDKQARGRKRKHHNTIDGEWLLSNGLPYIWITDFLKFLLLEQWLAHEMCRFQEHLIQSVCVFCVCAAILSFAWVNIAV